MWWSRRRRPGRGRPARQGRPEAFQGVHRVSGGRDRCLAGRDPRRACPGGRPQPGDALDAQRRPAAPPRPGPRPERGPLPAGGANTSSTPIRSHPPGPGRGARVLERREPLWLPLRSGCPAGRDGRVGASPYPASGVPAPAASRRPDRRSNPPGREQDGPPGEEAQVPPEPLPGWHRLVHVVEAQQVVVDQPLHQVEAPSRPAPRPTARLAGQRVPHGGGPPQQGEPGHGEAPRRRMEQAVGERCSAPGSRRWWPGTRRW